VLHDVVEDTPCTIGEVRAAFGGRVADMVGWVTKPETADGADKKEAKEAYLARLAGAPDDAVLVKLADRASNVQTLRNLGLARQRDSGLEDRDFTDAGRQLDRLPDGLFARYGLGPADVARLRERFAGWPRG